MDTPTKSPEQVIVEMRTIVTSGGTLTREQVRETLDALRRNRLSAADASRKNKAAGPKAPVRSPAELLAALKGQVVTS